MSAHHKLSLFLENNRASSGREAAYVYDDPVEIITVTNADEIGSGFERVQDALAQGHHVAGWISYEAGLCFEEKLKTLLPENLDVPLVYMGVYQGRKILDAQSSDHHWRGFEDKSAYELSNLRLSQDRESYQADFDKIQDYLTAGDIYQVNYTQKASFDFEGSSKAFYAALRNAQAVEFAAYIESDDLKVLSLSPELFVRKDADKLTTKPMKGTCRRGRTLSEDEAFSSALLKSDKERAENLMIVDLIRNDLSKLADKGSVEVSKLFEIEKYRTLFTMTSTVEAKLGGQTSAIEVLKSIFPCGSVTGAPKIRAQQIISELESHQRGIYTGAIGYFTPTGDMCFSVPIRTIVIDENGSGELGIGGAIVADSVASGEYDECLLKAEFLSRDYPRFDLIEAMLWTQDKGISLIDKHLERLENSAEYYGFLFNRENIERELKQHVEFLGAEQGGSYKIRLLLSKSGNLSICSERIKKSQAAATVVISDKSTDSQNPAYFHKTTLRDFYSGEYDKYHAETGCFDVLFTNEKGELTEGSYTNLFIEKDNVFYTPPIECGLLGGIFRQSILEDETITTDEKCLYPSDLKHADQIYLCNSVRGLVPVSLVSL